MLLKDYYKPSDDELEASIPQGLALHPTVLDVAEVFGLAAAA